MGGGGFASTGSASRVVESGVVIRDPSFNLVLIRCAAAPEPTFDVLFE